MKFVDLGKHRHVIDDFIVAQSGAKTTARPRLAESMVRGCGQLGFKLRRPASGLEGSGETVECRLRGVADAGLGQVVDAYEPGRNDASRAKQWWLPNPRA